MKKMSTIVCPILSEKSHGLSEQFNKYVFKVHSPMNSDLLNSKVFPPAT